MLALERAQRAYLTTLIADMSPVRRDTMSCGQNDIVGVTLVDGPNQVGRDDQVKACMAMICETSANGATVRVASRPAGSHPVGRRLVPALRLRLLCLMVSMLGGVLALSVRIMTFGSSFGRQLMWAPEVSRSLR